MKKKTFYLTGKKYVNKTQALVLCKMVHRSVFFRGSLSAEGEVNVNIREFDISIGVWEITLQDLLISPKEDIDLIVGVGTSLLRCPQKVYENGTTNTQILPIIHTCIHMKCKKDKQTALIA